MTVWNESVDERDGYAERVVGEAINVLEIGWCCTDSPGIDPVRHDVYNRGLKMDLPSRDGYNNFCGIVFLDIHR